MSGDLTRLCLYITQLHVDLADLRTNYSKISMQKGKNSFKQQTSLKIFQLVNKFIAETQKNLPKTALLHVSYNKPSFHHFCFSF